MTPRQARRPTEWDGRLNTVSTRLWMHFPHSLRAPRGGRRLARSRSNDRAPACCKLVASALFLLLPVGFIGCNQSTDVEPSRTSPTITSESPGNEITSSTEKPTKAKQTTSPEHKDRGYSTTTTTKANTGGGGFNIPTPTTLRSSSPPTPQSTTTTARTTATTEPDNGGGGFRVPTPTTMIEWPTTTTIP